MELIVGATLDNVRFLRAEARIGSIELGKLTDLVLVEGDVLRRVMLNGALVRNFASDPVGMPSHQRRMPMRELNARCATMGNGTTSATAPRRHARSPTDHRPGSVGSVQTTEFVRSCEIAD